MNVRRVLPRDAIPSVDDPRFSETYGGSGDDEVISVGFADPPRAYPVRYLQFHEIVNDVVDDATDSSGGDATGGDATGGDPIAVTWCPLCGSGIVYDRTNADRTLEFGVSGKLADDDLVMYDRETGSEWKQSTGECIAGAFEGESLSVRPAAMLSVREFRDSYPDGVVLAPPGGESEAASDDDDPAPVDYDASPYEEYASSEGFGLAAHRGAAGQRKWEGPVNLDPKTVVVGVESDGDAVGFPVPWVRAAGGVRTTVGERDVVAFATKGGVHAYADPGHEFEVTDTGVAADGTTWDPATGTAADGRRLDRLPARRLYAFTWLDDHGPDAFYRPDSLE
ncbi:DUF3179 domain-containing protein [Halorubrum sp. BOL3-1]|uniref:DUF3179 domain-containing protein n=1 Tax=Halorubrum sp. BOL3-1 TaxID=2497325 RepID=UPI001004E8D7|nr:DUF3179 domain-containing protein [Halorubrum sp. BOL3-1]QAU11915.1 DUF3179 domain-containing protein [Halorubrum sp. BOL3-1]